MRETNVEYWYTELHENFSWNSKELNKREGELIIRKMGNLNKSIAGRTNKEYYETKKR
jgi:hypothetical protein